MNIIIIYLTYFILGSLCLLTGSYFIFKTPISKSSQPLCIVLLTSMLLVRTIPILLATSFQNSFILVGSDQAFDHALTRYIVTTGHIQHNITIPRLMEYSYYPALHFAGSILSVIIDCDIYVVSALPIIEALILLPVFRRFFRLNITALLSLLLIFTNGYFSIFHVQYIREVYSFIIFSSLLLVVIKMTLRNDTRTFSDAVLICILTASLTFSHFYVKYFLLLILYILIATLYTHVQSQKKLLSLLSRPTVLIFTASIIYDLYMATAYVLALKPKNYLEEILNVYLRLIRIDISNSLLVEITSTIGVELPEYERLVIFINQLVPLALFIIFIFYIMLSREKSPLKKILFNLIFILFYYGFLLLKTAQDLYVINIGLRASQYVLLSFFLMTISSIEDLWLHYSMKRNKTRETSIPSIFFLLVILVVLSLMTYPSLLSPTLKGLAPSYYIPYTTAKTITPLFPHRTLSICVAVESPMRPESDLFRGFIYGFVPERTDFTISRICSTSDAWSPENLYCDVVFFIKELEHYWGERIFDTGLFSLYVPLI